VCLASNKLQVLGWSDLRDLVEVELNRGFTTEDRHENLELLLLAVDLADAGRKGCERAVHDGDRLADLEVDHRETQGSLWYVKYPILDGDGNPTDEFVRVATTRPETIVGDTAVAVNPEDDRWKGLIGRRALLTGPGNRV